MPPKVSAADVLAHRRVSAWQTREFTMKRVSAKLSTLLLGALCAVSFHAAAQQPPQRADRSSTITFYEGEGFGGRWFSASDRRIGNFNRFGFNDAANSVRVRGGRWEVCTAPRFEGRCVVLRRGDYPSLREAGLDGRISSARPVVRGNRVDDRRDVYDRQQAPVDRR